MRCSKAGSCDARAVREMRMRTMVESTEHGRRVGGCSLEIGAPLRLTSAYGCQA